MASRLLALGTSRRILRSLTLGPAVAIVSTTRAEHLSRALPLSRALLQTLTQTQTRTMASLILSPSPSYVFDGIFDNFRREKGPILPPGEILRDMPFNDSDMEDDDMIWSLYDRWIQFHGLSRSPKERLANYLIFKTRAMSIHEDIKKGRTPPEGLHQYIDNFDVPLPEGYKPKGLCLKCLARCFGSGLEDLKAEYDESGNRTITVVVTEPLLDDDCCPPQDSPNIRQG